jgi:hypothetical protein
MFDRMTKPTTFADCVGDELPFGWEYAFHHQIGIHLSPKLTLTTINEI